MEAGSVSTTAHRQDDALPPDWLHEARRDGAVAFRVGRRGSTVVAEWPGVARLSCLSDGSRARLEPDGNASRQALGKLRGVVQAFLGHLRGLQGFHASAVALGRDALLFIGESGSGKSTACATLCRSLGGLLLADDAALVELREGIVSVVPTEDTHYLSAGSCAALGIEASNQTNEKTALPAAHIASDPFALRLIVTLRFDASAENATVSHLRGSVAAERLLRALMRFRAYRNAARARLHDRHPCAGTDIRGSSVAAGTRRP